MCEDRSLRIKRGCGKAGRLRVLRMRRNAELLRRRLLTSDSEASQQAAHEPPAPPAPEAAAAPDADRAFMLNALTRTLHAARLARVTQNAARAAMPAPVAVRIPMAVPDAAIRTPADAARIAAVAQENSRMTVMAARAAMEQAPHRPLCQGPCCETARERRRESLFDIALRTAVLMRSNRELQLKLRALQAETRDYIKAVMRNRENSQPPIASTLDE